MKIKGNYWDKSPAPAPREIIENVLLAVFKENRYNHHGKALQIDYIQRHKFKGRIDGHAVSFNFYRYALKSPMIFFDKTPGYKIWLGIPKQFNVFELAAIIDHEVEHLQHPNLNHDEMMVHFERYELWKYILTQEQGMMFDQQFTKPVWGE